MTDLQRAQANLEAHNIRLGRARNDFFQAKAHKDHFEQCLVKAAPGESNAEKLMNAKADEEWLKFHKKLARLEAIYDFERLKFSLLEKEWFRCQLELKIDQSLIRKQE